MTPSNLELQLLQQTIKNFPEWAEKFCVIRDKDGNLVPFKLKEQQLRLWEAIRVSIEEGVAVRIIILKARQLGFSTMMQAFLLWYTTTKPGKGGLTMAHDEESAGELFKKIELMYDKLPDALHKELEACRTSSKLGKKKSWGGDLNSDLYVETAGNERAGRSKTFQAAHLSEVAFWDKADELMYGLFQSIPMRGSIIVVESTANGRGNWFHRTWQKSQDPNSIWQGLFFPWHEEAEYSMPAPKDMVLDEEEKKLKKAYKLTNDQLMWRRYKIEDECHGDVEKFRQEYPLSPEEAFIVSGDTYVAPKVIEFYESKCKPPLKKGRVELVGGHPVFTEMPHRAMDPVGPPWWIWKRPEKEHAYIIGADPAGGTAHDFSAAHIVDTHTLEVVATFQGKMDPDDFAHQLRWMARTYNDALIAPEKNGEGRATVLMLQKQLQYPRLFFHQHMEDWSGGIKRTWGWVTSTRTRPTMLAELNALMRSKQLKLWCERTIRDISTFIRVEGTKIAEADEGAWDDMVMSLAIAVNNETRQLGATYVRFGDPSAVVGVSDE